MKLGGRRILVTGAASGIGLATAQLFARQGAAVALVDRDAEQLEAAAEQLKAAGQRCVAAAADVSDEAQVRAAVEAATRQLGGLDGLVNAAGIDLLQPLQTMESDAWAQVVGINLTGPYLVCRAALPALRAAGKGTIVNIASGAALRPLEHRTAYCASKAGLVMFGKALAIELAPFHIRVNAVCPGIIDTPLFRASFEAVPDPQAELRKILDRYVIRRVGQPVEIGYAALYLSCDESAFVTGIALAVDGGRTLH